MTEPSGNPAEVETFYTRNDGTIISCLDKDGEFKHDKYCYEHGTRFIKGNCGRKICLDCKKDFFHYLNSCSSCIYYIYEQDYSVGYEAEYCEFNHYDNLKNWPFKNGCKHKISKH